MTSRRFIMSTVVPILLLLGVIGCQRDDGLERVPLSGTVSFKGKPVMDGQIRLNPKPRTMTPMTILTITNGRYDASSVGGVPVGQYRVEIRSFDPNTPAPTMPGQPQRTQLLPAQFNSQSTLELELKSGQTDATKDFNLSP